MEFDKLVKFLIAAFNLQAVKRQKILGLFDEVDYDSPDTGFDLFDETKLKMTENLVESTDEDFTRNKKWPRLSEESQEAILVAHEPQQAGQSQKKAAYLNPYSVSNAIGNATSHHQLGQIAEHSSENTDQNPEQRSRALNRRSQTIELDLKQNSSKKPVKCQSPSSSKHSRQGNLP